jgi:hypothetical protein
MRRFPALAVSVTYRKQEKAANTGSIPVSTTINSFKINTYPSLVGHDWPPILGPFCGAAPTHRLLIEVTITITFLEPLPKGQLMNTTNKSRSRAG